MVIIGADHGGFALKQSIIEYLKCQDMPYLDVTDYAKNDNDDYPDISVLICDKVIENEGNRGIAICGSGIGISIACNKRKGIFAAPCYNEYTTIMARKDNNINVLCLGGRNDYTQDEQLIYKMIKDFLTIDFLGGRHLRRVNKMKELENRFGE